MPAPATARLSSPAQLVAGLPIVLGYTPTESLVVICCHEPRGRVGLTMRFDLPSADREADLAEDVVRRVRREGATRVIVAVYTDAGDVRARGELVDLILDGLDGVRPTEAVLVRGGRFWSYLCEDRRCCPPQGTPIETAADDGQVLLLASERVLRGQAVLPDRDALEASLAGPTGEAGDEALRECERECLALAHALRGGTMRDFRAQRLEVWARTLAAFREPPAELDARTAAVLTVSLADKVLRDVLAAEEDVPRMVDLLAELCRHAPTGYDAPVCTLFAWMAYCDGGGARVTIALERALAADPDYSLADLLQQLVLAQYPPSRVWEMALSAGPVARRRARRSGRSRGSRS